MEASHSLNREHQPPELAGPTEDSLAPVVELRPTEDQDGVSDYEQVHGKVQVPGCQEETPWTLNIPHTLDSPYIHVFIPGFGGFKRSSRRVRNALASQENFASLSFEPVRKGGRTQDLRDSQKAHKDTLPAILQSIPGNQQLKNAPNGEALDMNKVVLGPHSMGGISAVEHAINHPDEVAHMVLIASVGLEGKVGFNYARRLRRSGQNEILPAITRGAFGGWRNSPHLAKGAYKYYLGNPLRTVGEMASLFQVDLRPKVAGIGALGIKMAIYNFELDELVPAYKSIDVSGHLVDHFEVAEGLDHLAPQTQPLRVAADIGRISRQLAELNN